MSQGTESFITIVVAACLTVAAAIAIVSGTALYRARGRGQVSRAAASTLLHKALAKFIGYEGAMLIAAGIDLLMRYSHIKQVLHLTPLVNVPIVTCAVGVVLLLAEIWSQHEASDKDADKNVDRLSDMAVRLLSDERLADKVRDVITFMNKGQEDGQDKDV